MWSEGVAAADGPLDEAQTYSPRPIRNLAHKVGCSRPAARKGIGELVGGGYLQDLESIGGHMRSRGRLRNYSSRAIFT